MTTKKPATIIERIFINVSNYVFYIEFIYYCARYPYCHKHIYNINAFNKCKECPFRKKCTCSPYL